MRPLHAGLMATAMIAGTGASLDVLGPPLRSASNHRPRPPRTDTALAREIAEHNAAVERRKTEKKARKQGR